MEPSFRLQGASKFLDAPSFAGGGECSRIDGTDREFGDDGIVSIVFVNPIDSAFGVSGSSGCSKSLRAT